MPLTFDMKIEYGRMTIRQKRKDEEKPRDYVVKIVQGNCLAVWIYETPNEYQLFFFLGDKAHGERIIKGSNDHTLLGEWKKSVVKVRLNMYYKEVCTKLLDLFMKSGYHVECYYKEPKKRKEAKNVRK